MRFIEVDRLRLSTESSSLAATRAPLLNFRQGWINTTSINNTKEQGWTWPRKAYLDEISASNVLLRLFHDGQLSVRRCGCCRCLSPYSVQRSLSSRGSTFANQ